MSWLIDSTIGKKLVMAVTGIFLILFLLAHAAGNILLFKDDGGVAFNAYAHFMRHNPLIIASELILFGGFIFHIIWGIQLIFKNKSARKVKYAVQYKSDKVSSFSKMMGALGTIILIFLIIHLWDFFRYKFVDYFGLNDLAPLGKDAEGVMLLYQEVIHEFSDGIGGIIHVVFYVLAMVALSFHLHHGFQSAFQTFGLNHKKYTPLIKTAGSVYSIAVPAFFASIPITIYIQNM